MKTYKNWTKAGTQAEQEMEDGHIKEWKNTINALQSEDLSNYSILDFGCNQGAFLRHLHEKYPFNKATGIDLSEGAIEIAKSRKANLPIEYYTVSEFANKNEKFDVVISNSVIFFIPDLQQHAQQIKEYLNKDGVYYFSFCDFIKSQNIASLKQRINEWAETPLVIHSIDEIVKVFSEEGFEVEIKRMQPRNFITLKHDDQWNRNANDRLELYYRNRYIFRMVKQ